MKPCDANALIRARRSIRKYQKRPVPSDMLDSVMEAALHAPSPSNRQPISFFQIFSGPWKEKLKADMEEGYENLLEKAAEKENKRIRNHIRVYYRYSAFMFDAPVLFAAGTIPDPGSFSRILEAFDMTDRETDADAVISLGCAIQNILLKALSFGMGACILTAPLVFLSEKKPFFHEDFRLRCFLTLGFPDETPAPIDRKTLSEILFVKNPDPVA